MIDVTFFIDPSNPDHGQIRATIDLTALAGANNAISSFKIEDPLGNTIRDYPVGGDFTTDTGDTILMAIPKDVDGNFVEGDYTVTYKYDDSADAGPVSETPLTLSICPDLNGQALAITTETDCYSAKFVAQDKNVYNSAWTINRVMEVNVPATPGNAAITVNTTGTELVQDLTHENISVVTTLNVNRESEVTATVEAVLTYTLKMIDGQFLSDTHEVVCDIDGCGIADCVNDRLNEINEKACEAGGFSKLSQGDKDQLMLIQSYFQLYNTYNACNKFAEARAVYDKLKELVDDCDCNTSTEPKSLVRQDGIVYLQLGLTEWTELNNIQGTFGKLRTRYRTSAFGTELDLFFTIPINLVAGTHTLFLAGSIPSQYRPAQSHRHQAFLIGQDELEGYIVIAADGSITLTTHKAFSAGGNTYFNATIPND